MVKQHAIVDACVAMAIGDPTVEQMANARKLIDALATGPVGVCMTDALVAEWDKHASKFMKKWLAKMVSKGRTRHERDTRLSDYRRVLKGVDPTMGKAAMLKDAHLVEAAILCRAGVLSLDDKQRRYLAGIVPLYPRVGRIQWFNPESDFSDCEAWLAAECCDVTVCCLVDFQGDV